MSQYKILHISDLHISREKASVLQNGTYWDSFLGAIQEHGDFCALVVSGDIADRGGTKGDYDDASKIIGKIKTEIGAQHVVIVPGNHDVSREQLLSLRNDGIAPDMLWTYTNDKLHYFKAFLEKLALDSDIGSPIPMHAVMDDEKVIILGLDSTYRLGTDDGIGYINVDELEASLERIFSGNEEQYKEYTKIAVLHHTPIVYHSESQRYPDNNSTEVGQYGLCDSQNWDAAKEILLKHGVHIVLAGHVHGTQSESIQKFEQPNDKIFYSIVGSVGVNFNHELKDLDVGEDYKAKLETMRCYVSLNGNHNSFNVISVEGKDCIVEEQYKFVVDEGTKKWVLWSKKQNWESKDDQFFADPVRATAPVPDKKIYTDALLKMVRDNRLYKTGHFHWKGRALLNWIDVSYFFHHREALLTIIQGIRHILEHEMESAGPKYIIGFGVKGSILLSYVRYIFPESSCSYYPEGKKAHNDYELCLFGEKKLDGPIVLLTDVVHSGDTVKGFIEQHFAPMENAEIHVVTVFDTSPNNSISSIDHYKKIQLHALAEIRVSECNGGMKNCQVYVNKLSYVYECEEDKEDRRDGKP